MRWLAQRFLSRFNDYMVRPLVCLLPFLCLLFTTGGGNKSNAFLISIHEQASEDEYPKFAVPVKLGADAKQYFFKKVATFTDHDIAYFYPFIAQDGITYGAALKLKNKGAEGLKSLSLTHQGKLLGCRFSPQTFSAVFIDQPIDHGTIVIWSGLSQDQIAALGKSFPHAEQVQRALGGGG
jgi:hypothetical protein